LSRTTVDTCQPVFQFLANRCGALSASLDPKGKIMSEWRVYLSGEIHTDWREQIVSATEAAGLPVSFSAPVTNHEASDDCGAAILGSEDKKFWYDHKGAKVNAIRTRTLIEAADVVVVRFGDQYKQWNAAFDAGYAAALGKPLIVLHGPDHAHALKEVDEAANVVAETPSQVAEALRYVMTGVLPR
jgi:YtoQ family protein